MKYQVVYSIISRKTQSNIQVEASSKEQAIMVAEAELFKKYGNDFKVKFANQSGK